MTSKDALEGERKQVTVLFADLRGSMELVAARDPEEARRLLDPVLERMMEAVHRYEGTVNQVMGDGIMALFGAPVAHEDHALRACYAALAMQASIRQYAEQARRSRGLDAQIRIGLNSGEVVVRAIGSDLHMDYTAVGQTTHLAARMEQLATPGAILMTIDTLRLVDGLVEFEVLGPMPVKGLAEPVEVCQLKGASTTRTRLEAAATRGLSHLVGRETELVARERARERAAAGHGQIVAVVGEPGVGKSRLYWEFLHSPRLEKWLMLTSGSVSYGKATAYLPVANLLKAYFQVDERDDAVKVRDKVETRLVQAVLAARIGRLPGAVKHLIQSAAVIGKAVPFTLLGEVAETHEDDLRRGLTHLQAAEFLYETTLFPELEYTFKHALTLEVAYHSLLHERRRTLHERTLVALERLYVDRVAEKVEVLAHHAVHSDSWNRAARYLYQAGEKALGQGRPHAAASFFEATVDALDRLGDAGNLTLKLDAYLELWVTKISTSQMDGPSSASARKRWPAS
jgi:class 3 adenylate cyclase